MSETATGPIPAPRLRRLENVLTRRRTRPGTLYHGCCGSCCSSSCCCVLMPIGNYIAVSSSHTRAQSKCSVWWHLFLNIACAGLSALFLIPMGHWPYADPRVISGAIVAALSYLALLQVSSRWWMPATTPPDRRFSIIAREWLTSIVLMLGFGAMSVSLFWFFPWR